MDTIVIFNLLPKPVVTDRLAIVCRLAYQMYFLSIQMCPEKFTVGKATLITICTEGNISLMPL